MQQGRATGDSHVEVCLLWHPSYHSHLPLGSGFHASLLQPRLGPSTASSLAVVVTRGYFKCSLLFLPSTHTHSLSFSSGISRTPIPHPLPNSCYCRCLKPFSISPPTSLLVQLRSHAQDHVSGLPFINIS